MCTSYFINYRYYIFISYHGGLKIILFLITTTIPSFTHLIFLIYPFFFVISVVNADINVYLYTVFLTLKFFFLEVALFLFALFSIYVSLNFFSKCSNISVNVQQLYLQIQKSVR